MAQETGEVTGTKDKDYNLIWFTEASLSNALRLETYIEDAEREGDSDLAEFFKRAQGASRKGGEKGKALLRERLAGGSAAGMRVVVLGASGNAGVALLRALESEPRVED